MRFVIELPDELFQRGGAITSVDAPAAASAGALSGGAAPASTGEASTGDTADVLSAGPAKLFGGEHVSLMADAPTPQDGGAAPEQAASTPRS